MGGTTFAHRGIIKSRTCPMVLIRFARSSSLTLPVEYASVEPVLTTSVPAGGSSSEGQSWICAWAREGRGGWVSERGDDRAGCAHSRWGLRA